MADLLAYKTTMDALREQAEGCRVSYFTYLLYLHVYGFQIYNFIVQSM